MNTIQGGCHCGAVRYESCGRVVRFVNCHCPDCRKLSGATFGSVLVVESAGFKLISGEDHLGSYQSSPGKHRCFCRICGSPVFKRTDSNPELIFIRAGSLAGDPGVRPQMHIWVKAKAPWYEICDDIQQYQEGPPLK